MGVDSRASGKAARISVIIPVFNGGRYLQDCLDSVSACRSPEIECIIVNDGSTDNTEEICRKQCGDDGRFRLISKVNTGVSDSRNRGLAEASGDYVFFLDADDCIDASLWPEVLSFAEQRANDMVAFGYVDLFVSGKTKKELFPDGCDLRLALLSTTLMNTCWGKLFRREIITRNSLTFRRDLKTCEDAVFVLDFAQNTGSYALSDSCVVIYRLHPGGVMQSTGIDAKLSDFASLFDRRCEYLLANYDAGAREAMYRQFFSVITDLYRKYAGVNSISEVRKKFRECSFDPTVASILAGVRPRYLKPVHKKLEFTLLSRRRFFCLSLFFKMQALFAKRVG